MTVLIAFIFLIASLFTGEASKHGLAVVSAQVDQLTDLYAILNEKIDLLIQTVRDEQLENRKRDQETHDLIVEGISRRSKVGNDAHEETHEERIRKIDRVIELMSQLVIEGEGSKNVTPAFQSQELALKATANQQHKSSDGIMMTTQSNTVKTSSENIAELEQVFSLGNTNTSTLPPTDTMSLTSTFPTQENEKRKGRQETWVGIQEDPQSAQQHEDDGKSSSSSVEQRVTTTGQIVSAFSTVSDASTVITPLALSSSSFSQLPLFLTPFSASETTSEETSVTSPSPSSSLLSTNSHSAHKHRSAFGNNNNSNNKDILRRVRRQRQESRPPGSFATRLAFQMKRATAERTLSKTTRNKAITSSPENSTTTTSTSTRKMVKQVLENPKRET